VDTTQRGVDTAQSLVDHWTGMSINSKLSGEERQAAEDKLRAAEDKLRAAKDELRAAKDELRAAEAKF
jgi:hypothetical protein